MDLNRNSDLTKLSPSRILTQKAHYLDFIFRAVAKQRDLPTSKHELAEARYKALANWLDNSPDSDPLSKIKIKIYPIGSFLSGTPVKPVARDEFDLDSAGELQLNYMDYPDPRAAVDIFEKRLRKNKTYDEIIQRKTRVIRLNYSGDFHFDFMPCFPSKLNNQENTDIKIPHKLTDQLYVYKDSNPIGLNNWFEKQCQLRSIIKCSLDERAVNEIAPFPEQDNNKSSLKLALQLLKHARNVYFINDPEGKKSVPSVVLKVLIARNYRGEQNIYHILYDSINLIFSEIYFSNSPIIPNPLNDNEDFGEKWREDPDRIGLKKFKGFIYFCRNILNQIESRELLLDIAEPLKQLFGETEIKKAFDTLGAQMTTGVRKGLLGVASTGAILSSGAEGATRIREHKFYGQK